ncbi:MAG: hypothetical protein Q4G22_11865 [Paracoccus sp. (in: a-proteobacteria)]|uniref:hypothetical protein n=1 Tax=Paracoccus sp. TaxID=267 RepID=UPI0026E0C49C|nr:hypothetical protein [Paracoccus sp. (in: a-proteobacteria)]MDO5632519.1 hypothetical protein [Paracoccus sp. (in: a-proteobacteria)]
MPDGPLFLENAAYRRRRLRDAARVLPVLAFLAVMLPVWLIPDSASFAGGTIWFFVLWAGLVVAIALLHRALIRADRAVQEGEAARAGIRPDDV